MMLLRLRYSRETNLVAEAKASDIVPAAAAAAAAAVPAVLGEELICFL